MSVSLLLLSLSLSLLLLQLLLFVETTLKNRFLSLMKIFSVVAFCCRLEHARAMEDWGGRGVGVQPIMEEMTPQGLGAYKPPWRRISHPSIPPLPSLTT